MEKYLRCRQLASGLPYRMMARAIVRAYFSESGTQLPPPVAAQTVDLE